MKIPEHIGIILDGNRRWAKSRNLPTFEGHRQGSENITTIANYAFDRGIKIMSVFAFSVENWKRNQEEVGYLMDLFKLMLKDQFRILADRGIKLTVSGDITAFDTELRGGIIDAQNNTADNKNGIFNVCLNYGGREEIIQAIKKIIQDKINPKDIDQNLFNKYLYTAGLPDPDLIIRTSGEQRLSGFLTWQSVYSELYFVDKHWPDFSTQDFDKALVEYSRRQRRFGGN
ncbi:MAG: polyprenyl diphosphate synthase [Patescibacteria group bacterium]